MDSLTLPRVMCCGFVLGVAFTVGALIADLITTERHPRVEVFYDPADFLPSLHNPQHL